MIRLTLMKGQVEKLAWLYGLRDAVEDAGLRAVEFLIPLTVNFRELNHEFEVRTMKTCVSIDLPTAAPEDLLQVRCVFRNKSNTAAT